MPEIKRPYEKIGENLITEEVKQQQEPGREPGNPYFEIAQTMIDAGISNSKIKTVLKNTYDVSPEEIKHLDENLFKNDLKKKSSKLIPSGPPLVVYRSALNGNHGEFFQGVLKTFASANPEQYERLSDSFPEVEEFLESI